MLLRLTAMPFRQQFTFYREYGKRESFWLMIYEQRKTRASGTDSGHFGGYYIYIKLSSEKEKK